MSFTLLDSAESLSVFLLVTIRLIALFMSAPALGHKLVPLRIRLGLALLVCWVLEPEWGALGAPTEPIGFAIAALREALVGLALGLGASLTLTGFALMAEFVSVQGGLGAATVLDPTSGASSVVLTSLANALGLVVFVAIGGHHDLLRAVSSSLEAMPPGPDALPSASFWGLASLGSLIFDVAARVGAPFTAVMLASNAAVGILGRAIPQFNLMALQLPAQIGVTLLVLGLAAAPITEVLRAEILEHGQRATAVFLEGH